MVLGLGIQHISLGLWEMQLGPSQCLGKDAARDKTNSYPQPMRRGGAQSRDCIVKLVVSKVRKVPGFRQNKVEGSLTVPTYVVNTMQGVCER